MLIVIVVQALHFNPTVLTSRNFLNVCYLVSFLVQFVNTVVLSRSLLFII